MYIYQISVNFLSFCFILFRISHAYEIINISIKSLTVDSIQNYIMQMSLIDEEKQKRARWAHEWGIINSHAIQQLIV